MFYGLFLSKVDELIWAKTSNILPDTCILSSFVQKDIENFPVLPLPSISCMWVLYTGYSIYEKKKTHKQSRTYCQREHARRTKTEHFSMSAYKLRYFWRPLYMLVVAMARNHYHSACIPGRAKKFRRGRKIGGIPRLLAEGIAWHAEPACACLRSRPCRDWGEAFWAENG